MADVEDEAADDAETAQKLKDIAEKISAMFLCETYGSQLGAFPDNIVETLAAPTSLRDGKEAFLAFRYGEKRFKVTFEQIDRLRIPKGAKNV